MSNPAIVETPNKPHQTQCSLDNRGLEPFKKDSDLHAPNYQIEQSSKQFDYMIADLIKYLCIRVGMTVKQSKFASRPFIFIGTEITSFQKETNILNP